MNKDTALRIFEDKRVRVVWNEEEEKWYFSVIDVISVLTNGSNSRRYWSDLKRKLKSKGSKLYEKSYNICNLSK